MILPITLTMAAAAVIMHIWLAFRCSRLRASEKISVGDGNHPLLLCRMRAHSNFIENAPLFLILLFVVELARGQPIWLWIAGILFMLARISHALGMERPSPNPFRAGGMMLTLLSMLALAVYAIILARAAGQPVMIG